MREVQEEVEECICREEDCELCESLNTNRPTHDIGGEG